MQRISKSNKKLEVNLKTLGKVLKTTGRVYMLTIFVNNSKNSNEDPYFHMLFFLLFYIYFSLTKFLDLFTAFS